MKQITFSILSTLLPVFAGVLLLSLPACQSDAGSATQAQSEQQAPQVNPRKVVQEYLARARKSEQAYRDFHKNIVTLQKEVEALPARYKTQAANFAVLEGDLAAYPEKGTVMLEEAAQVVKELETQLESDWAMSESQLVEQNEEEIIGSVLYRRVKALEISESSYVAAHTRLKNAVDKLKQAKGAPVVLFE